MCNSDGGRTVGWAGCGAIKLEGGQDSGSSETAQDLAPSSGRGGLLNGNGERDFGDSS